MSEQDIFNDEHSVEPQVSENVSSKSNNSQSSISSFIDYVEVFVVALSLVIIIFSFFLRICKVQGPSMENT